jgi:hypothetical protein
MMKEIQFPEVKVGQLLLSVAASLVRALEWQTKGLQPLTVKCASYCGIVTVQWRCWGGPVDWNIILSWSRSLQFTRK